MSLIFSFCYCLCSPSSCFSFTVLIVSESHAVCFLLIPCLAHISPPPFVNSWLFIIPSYFVSLTFYLFLILASFLLFLLFILDFSLLYVLSASLGPFSFPALCVSLFFVLCSLCLSISPSLFFSCSFAFSIHPPLGISASPWVCVSYNLLSVHMFVCVCMCVYIHVCMFVTKGLRNPFPIGAECLLSKEALRSCSLCQAVLCDNLKPVEGPRIQRPKMYRRWKAHNGYNSQHSGQNWDLWTKI